MIKKLAENYQHIEQTLIEELKIDGGSGISSAPDIWHPVFKRIVPTKYNVEKNVYIIDSERNVSEKVSLAIYDEQYTPYIFNHGMIKYIPIEAVFAVVLCEDRAWRVVQNTIEREDKNCKETRDSKKYWLCKLQKLKTDMNAYVRIQSIVLDTDLDELYQNKPRQTQAQTSTRPITILCKSFPHIELDDDSECLFDIVLKVEGGNLIKEIPEEDSRLEDWYKKLNHYGLERYNKNITEKGRNKQKLLRSLEKEMSKGQQARTLKKLKVKKGNKEQVLLSLMFQLNQLLILINNPMFFPHASYVSAFYAGEEKK